MAFSLVTRKGNTSGIRCLARVKFFFRQLQSVAGAQKSKYATVNAGLFTEGKAKGA